MGDETGNSMEEWPFSEMLMSMLAVVAETGHIHYDIYQGSCGHFSAKIVWGGRNGFEEHDAVTGCYEDMDQVMAIVKSTTKFVSDVLGMEFDNMEYSPS